MVIVTGTVTSRTRRWSVRQDRVGGDVEDADVRTDAACSCGATVDPPIIGSYSATTASMRSTSIWLTEASAL